MKSTEHCGIFSNLEKYEKEQTQYLLFLLPSLRCFMIASERVVFVRIFMVLYLFLVRKISQVLSIFKTEGLEYLELGVRGAH